MQEKVQHPEQRIERPFKRTAAPLCRPLQEETASTELLNTDTNKLLWFHWIQHIAGR